LLRVQIGYVLREAGAMRTIVTFLLISIAIGLFISGSHRSRAAESPPAPATQPAVIKYRIVRVVIPTDSAHRKNPGLKQPPDLYVIVKEDGKAIGTSGSNEGWEVEYDATKTKNRFDIKTSNTVSYTIELWDYNHWSRDKQVLSITGLKAGDFAAPIFEHLGELDPKDRATRIEFKRVD
jgi:hypothetical protein